MQFIKKNKIISIKKIDIPKVWNVVQDYNFNVFSIY